jgi:hypothetical protein
MLLLMSYASVADWCPPCGLRLPEAPAITGFCPFERVGRLRWWYASPPAPCARWPAAGGRAAARKQQVGNQNSCAHQSRCAVPERAREEGPASQSDCRCHAVGIRVASYHREYHTQSINGSGSAVQGHRFRSCWRRRQSKYLKCTSNRVGGTNRIASRGCSL